MISEIKISAVIRTLNSGYFLEKCILSILNQTVKIDEIIIVDSGSRDNTIEIAKKFKCRIFYYPSDEVFNYSKALNIGFRNAIGKYVLSFSSHVAFNFSDSLEYMAEILNQNLSICSVSMNRTDAENPNTDIKLTQENIFWKLSGKHNFDGQAMFNFCSLVRKKDWEEYSFNESLPTAEDQEWAKYFIFAKNKIAVIVSGANVLYASKNYSMKKDIREYLSIAKDIDPKWGSWKRINTIFRQGIKGILYLNRKKYLYNFTLLYFLVSWKITGKFPSKYVNG